MTAKVSTLPPGGRHALAAEAAKRMTAGPHGCVSLAVRTGLRRRRLADHIAILRAGRPSAST